MSGKEQNSAKRLYLASSHGFCNGVKRALDIVRNILNDIPPGQTLYIYNEIVHNSFIVNELKNKGVVFVHQLDEVPPHNTIVWSAHGVPPQLERNARARELTVKDATCPLVKRLHDLASEYSGNGDIVIFIGHAGHPESIGVLGCGKIYCAGSVEDCRQLPDFPPGKKIYVLTQTTWCRNEIDDLLQILQQRYSQLEVVSGICYATAERQQAVRDLIEQKKIEKLLVIGSPKSSNSNRLCEVAMQYNVPAQLVDDPEEILNMPLAEIHTLGITAGASAPEILLQKSLDILEKKYGFKLIKD